MSDVARVDWCYATTKHDLGIRCTKHIGHTGNHMDDMSNQEWAYKKVGEMTSEEYHDHMWRARHAAQDGWRG